MKETQLRAVLITILLGITITVLAFNPSDETSDRFEGMLYVLLPAFLDSVRVTKREITRKAREERIDPLAPDPL